MSPKFEKYNNAAVLTLSSSHHSPISFFTKSPFSMGKDLGENTVWCFSCTNKRIRCKDKTTNRVDYHPIVWFIKGF